MVGVTEEEVPCARQCCSDACVLGYVSISEEENINRVEHSILCDWEDPGYTWKDEINLVWENTGKYALNQVREFISEYAVTEKHNVRLLSRVVKILFLLQFMAF